MVAATSLIPTKAGDRVKHLKKEIELYIQSSIHEPVINALKDLKGINLIIA